jgi:hypothetical protein
MRKSMKMFSETPLFTDTYPSITALNLVSDSAFLYAVSDEDRSAVDAQWMQQQSGVVFVKVTDQDDIGQVIRVEINGPDSFQLRSEHERTRLLDKLQCRTMYLDITGLSHATWAPILKCALEGGLKVAVLYQEPEAYKARRGTEQQTRFDLSVGRTLGPLPGFEKYDPTLGSEPDGTVARKGRLLVLMGFEGDRFGYILNNLDFGSDRVYPVLGVPGFRIEFIAHALLGNERPIRQINGQARLRYVPAHCPFSLAYLVAEMLTTSALAPLTLAPIGTKPHALGAVLSAVAAPERIEIIYDHPTRNVGRSRGRGRTFLYHVSEFINGWSLPA